MTNKNPRIDSEEIYDGSLNLKGRIKTNTLNYSVLAVLAVIFFSISLLYFVNLMRWSKAPDFGWTVGTQLGALEIIHLRKAASAEGLRVGDRFLSVNGRSVASLAQVREYLDREIPGENVYEVSRDSGRYTIVVQNAAMGFGKAFVNYGVTWLLGTLSFVLGAAVFFMKPGTRSSWAFLLATFTVALFITFSITSKLSPDWLARILTFGATFSSAAILHLALVFPRERKIIRDRKILIAFPYVISAILFIVISFTTRIYTDAPRALVVLAESYRGLTILFLLFCTRG